MDRYVSDDIAGMCAFFASSMVELGKRKRSPDDTADGVFTEGDEWDDVPLATRLAMKKASKRPRRVPPRTTA